MTTRPPSAFVSTQNADRFTTPLNVHLGSTPRDVEYIEVFYNGQRLHSSSGYRSPAAT